MEDSEEPPDKPPDISYRIGNTPFVRSRNIMSSIEPRRIYLKFEGGNPTGTQKDRASLACLRQAKEMDYNALAIATCGNFGASFAYLARGFGLTTHVYIPANYRTERVEEIANLGGVIHRVEGTYEDVVHYSSVEAKDSGWYNANPGDEANTKASLEGYAGIAYEIYMSLGYVPDAVAVPVGNGTTFAGVYHGFKMLFEEGETESVPRMIAASTSGGNPIVRSFLSGRRVIEDLSPMAIKETSLNEPLVSWHSFDGQLALDALWESNGWATYVSDHELVEFGRMLAREEGLLVLPASASSLAALARYAKHMALEKVDETFVAVLTARRPYARSRSRSK
jgi:threonine synthase